MNFSVFLNLHSQYNWARIISGAGYTNSLRAGRPWFLFWQGQGFFSSSPRPKQL